MFKDVIMKILNEWCKTKKVKKFWSGSKHTKVNNFINNYYILCRDIADKYEVNVEIMFAQFALETGWGTSEQFLKYNITHNIKYNKIKHNGNAFVELDIYEFDSNGKRLEYKDTFLKFDSIEQSLINYCEFMKSSERYKDVIGIYDFNKVAELIEENRYATDSVTVGTIEFVNNDAIIYVKDSSYNEKYIFNSRENVLLSDGKRVDIVNLKHNDSIKIYAKKLKDIIIKNKFIELIGFFNAN